MEKDEVVEIFARNIGVSVGIAASLYGAGYRSMDDIRNADIIDLTLVKGVGPALASKIKKQAASKQTYKSEATSTTEHKSKNKSRKTRDEDSEDEDDTAVIFVDKPKRSKKSEDETVPRGNRTNAAKKNRPKKESFKLGFTLPKMDEKDRKIMWTALFAFTVIWLIFVSVSLSSTWVGIEFVDKKGATKTVVEFTLTKYDVTTTSAKGTSYYSDSITNLQKSDNVKQVFFTTNDYARTLWTMAILSFVMVGFMWIRLFLWDPLEIIEDRIKSYKTRFMKRLSFINIANVTKLILAATLTLLIITPLYFATAIQEAANKDYGVGGASTTGGVSIPFGDGMEVGTYSLLLDKMIGLYVLIFAFLLTVAVLAVLSRQYLKTLAKQLLVALK
ncbi:MAG: helix-hairpin-helix domain-containing protein [Thermoplasmata archaeon]